MSDKPIVTPNVTTRFTVAQREWLDNEADRLDRPIGWILRQLVAKEMGMPDSASGRWRGRTNNRAEPPPVRPKLLRR
jgi:hypothetical protein